MALVLLFLYIPIFVLIVFSFNVTKSRSVFSGFTFDWYIKLFHNGLIMKSLLNTVIVATVASIAATILGTAAAIGINNMKKLPRTIVMQGTNIPIINPEIVTGVSLMLLFVFFAARMNFEFGFVTLIIAHITFDVPYVILNIMPKFRQMNPHLYEAAQDLGCSPVSAFFKVVLPEILPGVISGFALAITLSLDDYFIASYTKPATFDTISTYVVNATKGSQTEIKTALWALSTVIFVIVILIVVGMNMTSKAKARAGKAGGRYE